MVFLLKAAVLFEAGRSRQQMSRQQKRIRFA
jgi:hypothetical protein